MRIILRKSTIGCNPKHKKTVKALGLRKIGQVRELSNTPVIYGMVRQVQYLLEVHEHDKKNEKI